MTKRIPARKKANFFFRAAYEAGFLAFAAIYLPAFLAKGKHRDGFGMRLGRVPEEARRALAGRRVIWIHAVSVGEVAAAQRVLSAMKEKHPEHKFVLTVTTATGMEVAKKIVSDDDVLLYFPIDLRACVLSFIEAVKPSALVLMETEIWPNLILELSERDIPVFIVNGRISDKAIGKYRRLGGALRGVLGRLSGIGAQDETMKSRFVELGAEPSRVRVTGNIKFDWKPATTDEGLVERIGRAMKLPGDFLCIAGSTHEGEEELLFDVYEKARARIPGFRLLVAPRHLTRLPQIEAAAKRKNVRLQTITDMLSASPDSGAVCVLDRMGILAQLYRAADVVFVGGSLVKSGGHNLVEPAYFGKPVLFGPHTHNFKEMAEAFLAAGAGVRVPDAAGLEARLVELSSDEEKRKDLGQRAKRLVRAHEGATERNVVELLSVIR